jgi:flagellar motor switch protein FliN/FliY
MPKTADAGTQKEQQDHSEPAAAADAKTEVHAAEFAEAPEEAPAAGSGQLDILLDMDVPVTVVLGGAQIPVRRLLQLGPGSVLQLDKPIEAPAELFLKDSKFAEADVVVVDNQFAVRIGQILGTGVPASGPQG